jgi:hypothetical protein
MAELLALTGKGASVKFPAKDMKIEQLGDLIEVLNRMAANEQERIRADIARNQTNLEILGTLQALIRKQGDRKISGSPVDFTPLVQILSELKLEREEDEHKNGGAYEFEIKRDGRGFAQKIVATPMRPTTH